MPGADCQISPRSQKVVPKNLDSPKSACAFGPGLGSTSPWEVRSGTHVDRFRHLFWCPQMSEVQRARKALRHLKQPIFLHPVLPLVRYQSIVLASSDDGLSLTNGMFWDTRKKGHCAAAWSSVSPKTCRGPLGPSLGPGFGLMSPLIFSKSNRICLITSLSCAY